MVAIDFHAQSFGLRRFAYQGCDVIEDGGEMKISALQLHAPGFDFRKIKNVVDDGQQVLSGVVDLGQPLSLFGRDAGAF